MSNAFANDDRSLLKAYLHTREDGAFAAIADRYGSMILATARRQTRDVHRADDVAQAVFLILARRADAIDLSRVSLGGWLHRTTLLASRNANRIDARRRRHEREAAMQRSIESAPQVADEQLLTALDNSIDSLGRRDCEIIALRYFESLDVPEIATRLDVNFETAKKRLARAMQRLRQNMSKRGPGVAADLSSALSLVGAPPGMPPVTLAASPASHTISKGTLSMMKRIALAKASLLLAAIVSVAAVGGVVTLAIAQTPPAAVAEIPADVEAQRTSTTQPSTSANTIEAAWADLAGQEPLASTALLTLASRPDESVPLLARELVPLQLTPEQFAPLLTALHSDDEKVWQSASEQLKYFDPRLAIGLEDLMDRVQDMPARNRLVSVLTNYSYVFFDKKFVDLRPMGRDPEHGDVATGFNFVIYDTQDDFLKKQGGSSIWAEQHVEQLTGEMAERAKPKWTRAIRAVVLLEHIGTPAARAIVDRLATGNPDARPTKIAKEAIAKRKS